MTSSLGEDGSSLITGKDNTGEVSRAFENVPYRPDTINKEAGIAPFITNINKEMNGLSTLRD